MVEEYIFVRRFSKSLAQQSPPPKRELTPIESAQEFIGDIFSLTNLTSPRKENLNLSKSKQTDLVNAVRTLGLTGVRLNDTLMRRQAYIFCNRLGIEHNLKKDGSKEVPWLDELLKEHPRMRYLDGLNYERTDKEELETLDKNEVRLYSEHIYNMYNDLFINHNPTRLYAMSFKTFFLYKFEDPQRGIPLVSPSPTKFSNNATIINCANAAGYAIPPMVIFQASPEYRQYLTKNAPCGTVTKTAPLGAIFEPLHSINLSLFKAFLNHLDDHKGRYHVLLLLEDLSLPIDYDLVEYAKLKGIHLRFFPENSHGAFQPLAAVNYNIETFWGVSVPMSIIQYFRNPTERYSIASFKNVWSSCTTKEIIRSGFREKGLYPLHLPTIQKILPHENMQSPY